MRSLATIFLGLVLLVIESLFIGLFDVTTWYPHVASGLVVYIALQRDMVDACLEIMVLAWFAELLSGSPPGVYALSLTLLFLVVRLSALRFSYRAVPFRIGLAMAAALAFNLILLGVLVLSGQPLRYVTAFAISGLPSCLTAPIGLLIIWSAIERLDRLFKKRTNTFSSDG